jgi:hypothetical protein
MFFKPTFLKREERRASRLRSRGGLEVNLGSKRKPDTSAAGILILCLLCLFVAGCSFTRGIRHPDGTFTVANYRFLWRSEAVAFTAGVAGTNLQPAPFNVQLKIGHSASDSQSVSAVTEGAVKGLTRP